MNDPMRILKADHREAERVLTRLADTDEGGEREELAQQAVAMLTAHMDMEESILYPLVAQHVGGDDEEEAQVEHGLVRESLQKMQAMLAEPGFGATVEMIKAGMLHHAHEEEGQILPELKDAMERDEWGALGDSLAEAKESAGMQAPEPPRRRSTRRKTKTGSDGKAAARS
ncbi:MAG: hemerythrin domain-containing protein [Acidimicrobiales bacterium]